MTPRLCLIYFSEGVSPSQPPPRIHCFGGFVYNSLQYDYYICCRRFVDLCGRALHINEQLINTNQQPYHENLQQCYISMAEELSQILHEPVSNIYVVVVIYTYVCANYWLFARTV